MNSLYQKPGKSSILRLHGISKNPKTGNFMLVMDYKKNNLRNYLDKNFKECKWKHLIEILFRASIGLKRIHELRFVHCSLHSGNILVDGVNSGKERKIDVFITGFGHSSEITQTNSDSKKKTLFGILPYIAPEILRGQPQSKESDVYSFGVIMAEMSTGKPPFYNIPHDENLARKICEEGLRPEINKDITPRIYFNLAKRCLDADPSKRPTFEELEGILEFWYDSLYGYNGFPERNRESVEIRTTFDKCDIPTELSYKCHKGASYTGRELSFGRFSPPKNHINHYIY